MRSGLVCTLILFGCVRAAASAPVLLFPKDTGGTAHLRLEVAADGKPADVVWAAFLDKLFDHFDRDADGLLSPAEAARVFPLPLPGGRDVKMEFAKLDADRDGRGSRAEFRAFYLAAGFSPVVAVVKPASIESLALADALFRYLDRDGNGQLSAAELCQAPTLLRRVDEDENEVLTAAELLGSAPPGAIPTRGLKFAPADERLTPDGVLGLLIGGKIGLTAGSPMFHLTPDGSHLTVPGGTCTVTVTPDDPTVGFRAAKRFYLAQFKAAANGKPVKKMAFDDDPSTQALAGLFDAADRDGDGMLTLAELEAFFALVESGVGCRVVVTVVDRGRNLFDLFDANNDGRLDLAELIRAARELPDKLAKEKSVTRDQIPTSYRISVGRGSVGDSFGPVPFGTPAKPKPVARAPVGGPRWFRSMDRNGDGFVSAAEFVGPPDLFLKLDTDGDGQISVREALK
ncbi:EF-hand domain-containing protein [Fimbriiglobus ruber]|uniref:EF-hand domain-containing protein n=1 Tax=Fimbriiglobus ruber TaxID=1908690 RepID=A0A225DG66_9BACT|nr:EF-hand domain-containing protein [Fimbriiglobus ruber]OWK40551.1 hypothetical protein FRUB_05470 [Fimbriiglobus ruber]